MIINGILTEVKNAWQKKKKRTSEAREDEDKQYQEMLEQQIHTWNLFFSLTELSRGDLDAEI